MKPFTTVTGSAVPMLRDNVDTDTIIRIERLAGLPRDALGPYAMEALRYRADGSEDPDCVLNRPPFRGAPILIAGANFGCGSSREAAVWALMGMGLRCVIAPSFGDIFHSNCFQNGLLPVQLDASEVERLADRAADGAVMQVDLLRCEISARGSKWRVQFDMDPLRRQGLLEGLDDIALTLRDDSDLLSWQTKDRALRPWAWPNLPRASS
jgi:3-isopropylmalate/(R)-2-methylmalate dehydratase small subunit